jgi:Fe-Mn family superoxide dismutase
MDNLEQIAELCRACVGANSQPSPAMALALAASFGSEQRWARHFTAAGSMPGGGTAWRVLSYSPDDGRLANQWAAERVTPAEAGIPILAMAFPGGAVEQVNWGVVEANYAQAVRQASAALGAPFEAAGAAQVIDVRRAGVYADAATTLPNARWHDPADVAPWIAQLDPDRAILVYCVHGHEVSRNTAVRLRAHGFNARYLEGGIEAWKAAGLPLAAK